MQRTSSSPPRFVALVLVAAGVCAGVHVGMVLWTGVVQGSLTWASPDVGWMAPLGYLILFAAGASLVGALSLAAPRAWRPALASGLVLFAAAMSALLWARGLHPLAVLALSAGLAIRVTPWWLGFERPWRMVAAAWAGVAVLAVANGVRERARRSADVASVAQGRAAPDAPNVLFIVMDVVRARSTSLHGHRLPTTPNLDSLARGGTRFDAAYVTAPWTLPSHASMFTGRWRHELKAGWIDPLERDVPTLAESFRAAGYQTGGFVGNLFYTSRETGLSRGFAVYHDYPRTLRQVLLSTTPPGTPFMRDLVRAPAHWFRTLREFRWTLVTSFDHDRRPAPTVSDAFLAWQAKAPGPFFAFLNYYDAHSPYDPPAPYDTLFPVGQRGRYEGAIRYIDEEIGRVVRTLAARGVMDNTLLVVTGDHGELFGEHGVEGHGNSLYEPVLHVPLLAWWPGHVPAGLRIQDAVSLRDLAATTTRLTGVPSRVPGTPWPLTDSVPTTPGLVFSSVVPERRGDPHTPVARGPMVAGITSRWHVIRLGDGHWEAFDARNDAGELVNRIADTAVAGDLQHVVQALRDLPPPITRLLNTGH